MNLKNPQHNQRLSRLPLGRQTFSTIIEADAVYIDKTPYLYRMVDYYPINQLLVDKNKK